MARKTLRGARGKEAGMRIMNIDLGDYERIALQTSEAPHKERWTECEVYFLPGAHPQFIARSLGMSRLPGERMKERRMPGGTLEKALKLFDNDTIVEANAIDEARSKMAEIEMNLIDAAGLAPNETIIGEAFFQVLLEAADRAVKAYDDGMGISGEMEGLRYAVGQARGRG